MSVQIRIAIVGGDERVDGDFPAGVRVERYGLPRDRGNGPLRALLGAIAEGGLDGVVVLVRWLGHTASRQVREACKRVGVPCRIVTGGGSSALRAVRDLIGEA